MGNERAEIYVRDTYGYESWSNAPPPRSEEAREGKVRKDSGLSELDYCREVGEAGGQVCLGWWFMRHTCMQLQKGLAFDCPLDLEPHTTHVSTFLRGADSPGFYGSSGGFVQAVRWPHQESKLGLIEYLETSIYK